MPAIADLTVKKNDNATDVVYVAKVPSSGDTVSAMWRFDAHGAPYAGLKPTLVMSSRWASNKAARRVDMKGTYDSYATDSTTTVSSRVGGVTMTFSITADQHIPQADIDEGVSQLTNLLTNSTVRSCLKAGFAAT